MIKAIVFDLDDTLYSEYDYVKSGFRAVANELEHVCSVSGAYDELLKLFDEHREKVFDRYTEINGLTGLSVTRMVETYRKHVPNIVLADDVKKTLASLRASSYKLGIITDGEPNRQRAKISALELADIVDKIIVTDELGGKEFRKPNPKAFELMIAALRIAPGEMMYIGDNPQKDFAVKKYLPIKTGRYISRKGLYDAEYLDGILPDVTISCFDEIENFAESIS